MSSPPTPLAQCAAWPEWPATQGVTATEASTAAPLPPRLTDAAPAASAPPSTRQLKRVSVAARAAAAHAPPARSPSRHSASPSGARATVTASHARDALRRLRLAHEHRLGATQAAGGRGAAALEQHAQHSTDRVMCCVSTAERTPTSDTPGGGGACSRTLAQEAQAVVIAIRGGAGTARPEAPRLTAPTQPAPHPVEERANEVPVPRPAMYRHPHTHSANNQRQSLASHTSQ